jgi:hypothetical protein
MRYKAIVATVGTIVLPVMGITAVETSASRSYSIDDASSTVTQGPVPTTMASESFAPPVKAAPPCGFTSAC